MFFNKESVKTFKDGVALLIIAAIVGTIVSFVAQLLL